MTDKSQNGIYVAFLPEFFDDGAWKNISTVDSMDGVPPPKYNAPVNKVLNLFGRAEAMALAWQYAAKSAAGGIDVEVRIQGYEVKYNTTARKLETGDELSVD